MPFLLVVSKTQIFCGPLQAKVFALSNRFTFLIVFFNINKMIDWLLLDTYILKKKSMIVSSKGSGVMDHQKMNAVNDHNNDFVTKKWF
jgi:hypothetical protein